MCNNFCIDFGKRNLSEDDIKGKAVIEVGALDVNGSLRPVLQNFHPKSYVGVDIEAGPGVDQICDAESLIATFGYNKFDVLICNEVLEHVKNWQTVIHNFKNILKPQGILLITTRSKGASYHGFPFDFWRYEESDFKFMFSDFNIEILEKEPGQGHGIHLKARKPNDFIETELGHHKLYSIIQDRRCSTRINSLYFSLVCSPVHKIFGNKAFASKIVYYNALPNEIGGLIKRKIAKLFKVKH